MNLAQHTQMWQWINEWQTKNNTKAVPNYVDVSSCELPCAIARGFLRVLHEGGFSDTLAKKNREKGKKY